MKSVISDQSVFFIPIETVCKGPATVCPPDLDVVEAARLMQERDLTAVVVAEEGGPMGLFSVRDLRRRVAESGGSLKGCTVGECIGSELIAINRRDCVFEAMFKMARHNVFRLGVVDDSGMLVGIVTATDLLRIQTSHPFFLYQEIEKTHSIGELRTLVARIREVIEVALRANTDMKNIVKLITGFHDAITLRLIALLDTGEDIRLPPGAAYLVLGSAGRGEQTLRTDQDNAIVYQDGLPPDRLHEVERFAARLVDALEEIGIPRCPGDIMASSPDWRHSLTEWKRLVDRWIGAPTPGNVLKFGMVQDLRPLCGDVELGNRLRGHILHSVRSQGSFFVNMADHVVRFPPPFTLFGRIRVEQGGPHRGMVDLKKAGIFAITTGASLLLLEAGMVGGSTWEKLERVQKLGVISAGDLATIEEAFSFLTKLRLQRQMRDTSNGRAGNHVDPQAMTNRERERLRQALQGVSTFLWIFRDHFNLDYNAI